MRSCFSAAFLSFGGPGVRWVAETLLLLWMLQGMVASRRLLTATYVTEAVNTHVYGVLQTAASALLA